MKVFAKLGWFIKQERKNYIFGILILLLVALIDLLPPQIIGRVIDGISFNTLTGKTLLIYLIILFLLCCINICISLLLAHYDFRGEYEVREDIKRTTVS